MGLVAAGLVAAPENVVAVTLASVIDLPSWSNEGGVEIKIEAIEGIRTPNNIEHAHENQ